MEWYVYTALYLVVTALVYVVLAKVAERITGKVRRGGVYYFSALASSVWFLVIPAIIIYALVRGFFLALHYIFKLDD